MAKQHKSTRSWPLYLFGALVFGVGLVIALQNSPAPFQPRPMPGIKADILTGKLKDEPITIVNFFASWCTPCLIEHPILEEINAHKNVVLIGIAYRDTPDAITKYLQDHGNPYDVVYDDPNGQVGIDWGIVGVPETFIIRNDQIINHIAGPLQSLETVTGGT